MAEEPQPWYKRAEYWVAIVAFTLLAAAAGFLTYRLMRAGTPGDYTAPADGASLPVANANRDDLPKPSTDPVLLQRVYNWATNRNAPVTPEAVADCGHMLNLDAEGIEQLTHMSVKSDKPYEVKNFCAQLAQQAQLNAQR